MEYRYELTGGELIFEKQSFVSELLNKKSTLRIILGKYSRGNEPDIIKNSNSVVVDFNKAPIIELDSNYKELFTLLKKNHSTGIKGKINIRVNCLATFYTIIDLNSNDNFVRIY